MAQLLGIDVGTSGAKVVLIDESGTLLAQASAGYPLDIPQPGWSQQNPEDWWQGVCDCLRQIAAELGERFAPTGIGLTGQMHGAVFLDASGDIVAPAILWNDQRTVEECEEIERTLGRDQVIAVTGNPALTGFQLPKLLWLRNHHLSAYQRVAHLLLPKDYIRYRLTGEFATDVSDASGTVMLDLRTRDWSAPILSALEVDAAILPRVYESGAVTGQTVAGGPLPAGLPVIAGGGDQAAGAVGTGAVTPGVVSVSLGTSGVVFASLPSLGVDPAGRVHTFAHANGGYHAMSVMLSCGGAVRWARDTFFPDLEFDAMTALAAESAPGAGEVAFLPYLAGERSPHNDPFARASVLNLSLANGRSDLARAVFEGVSFGLADGYGVLAELGVTSTELRVTGGGAKSDFWVQLLANLFDCRCVRLAVDEGPAMGAAILAGVGTGIWADVETACAAVVREAESVLPNANDEEKSALAEAYARFRAYYPRIR
ncbi:MAG: xylulokinase [Fimbriimonadaceae bacterium]|nr:xylulokinase [Fimbriimonadaceae bacterium]